MATCASRQANACVIVGCASSVRTLQHPATAQSKSFLLLFPEKEGLPCYYATRRSGSASFAAASAQDVTASVSELVK